MVNQSEGQRDSKNAPNTIDTDQHDIRPKYSHKKKKPSSKLMNRTFHQFKITIPLNAIPNFPSSSSKV